MGLLGVLDVHHLTQRPASALGVGVGAGAAAAVAVMIGRKVWTAARLGKGHPLNHRLLDLASAAMQRKHPVEAMSTYLNGFHMYADELGRQVEATHFCIHLRHDLHQCVIFDRNAPDARLIGIEYITTEERFRRLPDDEKRLWHSHHYEVKSGVLTAPGIPEMAEHAYFNDLVSTYGKTFHSWQYDRDDFPYGIPQLMMAFTDDGQANQAMIEERDRRLGYSTPRRRRRRADIPVPDVVSGANAWEGGRIVQTRLEEVDLDGLDFEGQPATGGGTPIVVRRSDRAAAGDQVSVACRRQTSRGEANRMRRASTAGAGGCGDCCSGSATIEADA